MDWGKSKNILIIAFIITNIFLIYNIEKDIFKNNSASIVKEKNIKDVIRILEEKNIKVEAEVPTTVLELPVLNVEYETYDEEKLVDIFGKEKNDKIHKSVINNKIIRYENYDEKPYIQKLDKNKARREAELFIRKYGFMTKDVIYWDTIKEADQYIIMFKQNYKGSFLEQSYMNVVVNKSGVKKFERMWLKPIKEYDNKKEIIPATKALLKCINSIDTEDGEVIIKGIDLGYWFDPSHISLTNSDNIKSGTAIPAWRVILNNGQIKFIPGYENY
ncbi:two-component system regulatory protein YycI [Crassaminicella thermophila]|uniref:two-component system regulatory protein YycI n=1 Tax=Crassaminicella thermophila TaxID=2599308 RepID=UPI00143CD4BD|nr:two-component system regulatory protein YycI [Crassaminicella thermophila]